MQQNEFWLHNFQIESFQQNFVLNRLAQRKSVKSL